MKIAGLLLAAAWAHCAAAPTELPVNDDWLLDPVPAALAQAVTDRPASTNAIDTSARTSAEQVEKPLSLDYLKLIWADARETGAAPLRWTGDDWRHAGLIGGGLVLGGLFLDRPIRDFAQRNRSASSDSFFRNIEKFGTKQYGLPLLAGFYAYGQFAGDDNAKETALDGLAANLISSFVTSTFKGVFGRARPNTGLGPGQFHPLQGDEAFPSGHATGAFTFAAVIAAHYDDVWVDTTAYTIASLVGVARIQLNAHWATDVAGGALVGGLIGHHLVEFNRRLRRNGSSLVPTLGSDGRELTLNWAF